MITIGQPSSGNGVCCMLIYVFTIMKNPPWKRKHKWKGEMTWDKWWLKVALPRKNQIPTSYKYASYICLPTWEFYHLNVHYQVAELLIRARTGEMSNMRAYLCSVKKLVKSLKEVYDVSYVRFHRGKMRWLLTNWNLQCQDAWLLWQCHPLLGKWKGRSWRQRRSQNLLNEWPAIGVLNQLKTVTIGNRYFFT